MNSQEQLWYNALVEKGHTPAMDDDELDIFFHEYENHNGPGCSTCGWSCCWHCDCVDVIPECPDRSRPIQMEFNFNE